MSHPSNRTVTPAQIANTDYRKHFVENSTHPFDFATGEATLVLSTAPFLAAGYTFTEVDTYPLGLAQQFSWNEGVNGMFVPELGSTRKVNTAGSSAGNGTISKIVISGPSLETGLYRPSFEFFKSFQTLKSLQERSTHDAMVTTSESMEWIAGLVSIVGDIGNLDDRHSTIATGGMNSLLYKIPFGLVEIRGDAKGRIVAINYFEQCALRGRQGGVSAGQFQMIDSVSFEFERMRPLLGIGGFSLNDQIMIGTPDPLVVTG